MSVYSPKRLRSLKLAAILLRALAALLTLWPFFLIAAIVLSPITPHMRWEYSYQDFGHHHHYLSCQYLGIHGFVNHIEAGDCPFFTLIDRRKRDAF